MMIRKGSGHFTRAIRRFATCGVNRQFYYRSTVYPENEKFIQITDVPFRPKSLLLLSTPSNLPKLLDEVISSSQDNEELQIIVTGLDSVASTRNGYSELWLDEYIKIQDSVRLEEKDDLNKAPRESNGIDPVSARKNWKFVESSFNMGLTLDGKSHSVQFGLANTVFSTNQLTTMFYIQPKSVSSTGPDNSGFFLSDLRIELPEMSHSKRVQTLNNLVPLYTEKDNLVVTDSIKNLLKSINNKSAAGYLEKNGALMGLASKETQVFAGVVRLGEANQRFKVIAGGGGWGSKANILAISPEAVIEKGDQVEFLMLTPNDRIEATSKKIPKITEGMVFECSYEEHNFSSDTDENTTRVFESFGAGSEKGFQFDGVNYDSAGEIVVIREESVI